MTAALGAPLSDSPAWTADPTDVVDAHFGAAAWGRDVDGDGFSDLLVRPSWYGPFPRGPFDGGYLYAGSPEGLFSAPRWTLTRTNGCVGQNAEVALAQDVGRLTGGASLDLLVSELSCAYSSEYPDAPDPRIELPLALAVDETGPGAAFWTWDDGRSQLGDIAVEDVNGDGYEDVILSATSRSSRNEYYYSLMEFFGGPSGLRQGAGALSWESGSSSVVRLGDVDGDGFGDVSAGRQRGIARWLAGSPDGLAEVSWQPAQPSGVDAGGVGSAGDVNGDGFADVMTASGGYAYVYFGGPAGPSLAPDWIFEQPPAERGETKVARIAGVGDVDADGYADLGVGVQNQGSNDCWMGPPYAPLMGGRALLFRGGPTGPEAEPAWSAELPGVQPCAGFGETIVGAGDVNGDGAADVAIGAPRWSEIEPVWLCPGPAGEVCQWSCEGACREGRMFLYLGVPVDEDPWRLAQTDPAAGVEVPVGGALTGNAAALAGRVIQTGPLGGWLHLAVEVKPVGTAFDGEGIVLSGPAAGGTRATATVGPLPPGAYHWRARVVYAVSSGAGAWRAFGDNDETEADFIVSVDLVADAGARADGDAADAGGADVAGDSADVRLGGDDEGPGRAGRDGAVRDATLEPDAEGPHGAPRRGCDCSLADAGPAAGGAGGARGPWWVLSATIGAASGFVRSKLARRRRGTVARTPAR